MKRFLTIILSIILSFSMSFSVFAFTDSSKNPYTGLKYTHDDKFSSSTLTYGIDISAYQPTVNWTKVKNDGIDYVILRAAYRGYGSSGTLCRDTSFDEHIKDALAAGLDVGAYIYSQAITVAEAQEEADYILNIIDGYDIELPIVFDYEYAYYKNGDPGRLVAANLSVSAATKICKAFCSKIESKGYTAMLYANQYMLTNKLNDANIDNYYDIWLANYYTAPKLNGKMYDCEYTYWQYDSEGSVNGVSGNIDCNFRYYKKPTQVQNLSVTKITENSASLSWTKVKGCFGYQVYKLDKSSNAYVKLKTIKGAAKTSITDTATNGDSYQYKVRAISTNKNKFYGGAFSTVVTSQPFFKINVTACKTTYATFNWSTIDEADGYEVLRSTTNDGTYTTIASTTKTSYTDNTTVPFKTYYYKIKSYSLTNNEKVYNKTSTTCGIYKAQPTLKTTVLNTNNSIKLTWENAGATGVQIFRKAGNGTVKKVKTIRDNKTTTFINTSLSRGVKYTYKLRQYVVKDGKTYYSNYTGAKSAITLKKPSVSLTSYSKAIKISYQKVSGASGYQIYMNVNGKYKLIKTTSKLNYKKTGLKSGNRYYIKVVAYKNVNGRKVSSNFSKVKSTKAK